MLVRLSVLAFVLVVATFPQASLAEKAPSPSAMVFLFQKQKDPSRMKAESERMAQALEQRLGGSIEARIPSDYSASVQGIVSGTADVAYVDSMSAILAERDGGASILLAESRLDIEGKPRTEYDSVFVARADSALSSFDDLKKNAQTLTMIFTSPTSTSGFIFPTKRMVEEGMLAKKEDPKKAFAKVAFAGSYAQALEQVASGLGDVAAVSNYAIEGKSPHVSREIATKLKIIGRTPGVPTHVVIARKGLNEEQRASIVQALLAVAQSDPQLLTDIYGAAAFVTVDGDKHVHASRAALELTNIPNPVKLKS